MLPNAVLQALIGWPLDIGHRGTSTPEALRLLGEKGLEHRSSCASLPYVGDLMALGLGNVETPGLYLLSKEILGLVRVEMH